MTSIHIFVRVVTLVAHLLLSDHFFLLILPFLLLNANLQAVVQDISDQVSLWDDILLERGDFRNVLGLGRLDMEEGYEDAHLHHVHEFLVEGLVHHVVVIEHIIVKNFDLVLLNQE